MQSTVAVILMGWLALFPRAFGQAYQWTTLAGNAGGEGISDGTGSAAHFDGVLGLGTDKAGNFYLSNYYTNTIKKMTPDGKVTTLAGMAVADGSLAAPLFNDPVGVATDSKGNVYVANNDNETISKITSDGETTVFAGMAVVIGDKDGKGAKARFNLPSGIVVDKADNLYVTDSDNATIRKITPAGKVTTFAGKSGVTDPVDGTRATARFSFPTAIAMDQQGNLYVADGYTCIRKITPAGVVTTLAGDPSSGGYQDGMGSGALFSNPTGLACDAAGNVYVADLGSETIRKVTPDGVVSTVAGEAWMQDEKDGVGSGAHFAAPYSVCMGNDGALYVGEDSTLRRVALDGTVTTVAGSVSIEGSADGSAANATFNSPLGLAVDGDGSSYVINENAVRKIAPDGTTITFAGKADSSGITDGSGTDARFNEPGDLVMDSHGNIYVADSGNQRIRKISPDGQVTTLKDESDQPLTFPSPLSSVAVDGTGTLYVGAGEAVFKVVGEKTVSLLAGDEGVEGKVDGTGSAVQFDWPSGLAVDGNGNVFVADANNNVIRKITPDGVVSTVTVNSAGPFGSYIFDPRHLLVDASGNLFITSVQLVTEITAAGDLHTLGGMASDENLIGDGVGKEAQFDSPEGIAIGANGDLYIADSSRVVVGQPLSYQPDVIVATQYYGTAGDNDYNMTSQWYEWYESDLKGKQSETVTLEIQNDGTENDSFVLTAGAGNQKVRIKYFAGTTDVTSQIVTGTFQTATLAPNGVFFLQMKLTGKGANPGLLNNVLVKVVSATDASAVDAGVITAVGVK